MRRVFSLAVAATIAATFFAPGTAGADHGDCHVSVDLASADNPHVSDPADDWGGLVFGGGTGEHPEGDIYREGTDLTGAWIARDAEGNLTAHVTVQSMVSAQPNSDFRVFWYYEGTDSASRPVRANRWVAGRDEGDQIAASYGYFQAGGTPAYVTVGFTTAHSIPGTPGEVVIDVPRTGTGVDPAAGNEVLDNANWGAPTTGLTVVNAQTSFIEGSPKPLPPPSPIRHGLVAVTDSTSNAHFVCDADI